MNTADRALESHPHLPIAHLLRAKIQIHLGELSSAVKSVRSALDNNPENHHLAAYLKYLVQKTEGKEPENIIGTDKDQITKKLNSDLRTCTYTSDPLFNETLENVLNGSLDVLELERDERIRNGLLPFNMVRRDSVVLSFPAPPLRLAGGQGLCHLINVTSIESIVYCHS